MRNTLRIILGCTLIMGMTISAGLAHSPHPVLKFCVYPSKSPKYIVSTYGPLVKFLSESIGQPIKLVTAPDRASFQERALSGEYDLALACVACYFELHEKKGFKAIARGEPSFTGGVYVRNDNPITSVDQLLQGKRIGAVQQYSYAGFLFWFAYLVENNLQSQLTSPYVFLENQDSIAFAILNGKVDAGIIRTDAFYTHKLQPLKKQLKMILESPPIPHFPFIASPTMDPKLIKQITEALSSLTAEHPEGKKLFASMGIKEIRSVTDKDYETFKENYTKAIQAWKSHTEN